MMANVIQVLEVGVSTAERSLRFDIDVYRTGDIGVEQATMEEALGALRGYKNEIFFGRAFCLHTPRIVP